MNGAIIFIGIIIIILIGFGLSMLVDELVDNGGQNIKQILWKYRKMLAKPISRMRGK